MPPRKNLSAAAKEAEVSTPSLGVIDDILDDVSDDDIGMLDEEPAKAEPRDVDFDEDVEETAEEEEVELPPLPEGLHPKTLLEMEAGRRALAERLKQG